MRHEASALAMATIQAIFRDLFLRAVSWSFARQTSDLVDEESFWIKNSKWSASPLVCLWIIIYPLFSTLRLANWGQVFLAIGQVTRGVELLEFFSVGYYCVPTLATLLFHKRYLSMR